MAEDTKSNFGSSAFAKALRKQLDDDGFSPTKANSPPSPVRLSGHIALSEKFVRSLQQYVEEEGDEDPELSDETTEKVSLQKMKGQAQAKRGSVVSNGSDRRMSLPVITSQPPQSPRKLPTPRSKARMGGLPEESEGNGGGSSVRGLPSPRSVAAKKMGDFSAQSLGVPMNMADNDEDSSSPSASRSLSEFRPKKVPGFTSVISFKPNRRLSLDVSALRHDSESLGSMDSHRRSVTEDISAGITRVDLGPEYDPDKPSYGFSTLPEDLWVSIFTCLNTKDLSRFARVGKDFHKLVHGTACLWRKITMRETRRSKERGDINSSIMRMAQAHGEHVRELYLWGCISMVDDSVRMLTDKCKSLEVLDLNGCEKVTQSAVADLIKANANIHTLNFSNTSLGNYLLEEVGIQSCITLCSLALSNCNEVGDDGIESLQACAKLKRLDVGGCYSVSGSALGKVFRACKNLVEVDLRYLDQVTDDELVDLADNAAKLTLLDLRNCTISNKSLLHIASKPPPLESIVLAQTAVGDEGVVALINACNASLTEIDVSACDNVTDEIGRALAGCAKLKSVNLSYAAMITSKALEYIASGDSAETIETLLVNGCQVTNMGLLPLQKCTNLSKLGVSSCVEITRPGLQPLNDLKKLNIEGVTLGSPNRCGTPPPMWGSENGDPLESIPTPRVTIGPGDVDD